MPPAPRIDLLYIAGCPGRSAAESALSAALSEEGMSARVRQMEAGGQTEKFSGSPTLLFDGEDPFPAKPGEQEAPACRVYATSQGLKKAPTVQMLREALRRSYRESR